MFEIAEFLSTSPEETSRLGERLAAHLRAGDVVALTGAIGAGKSLFARAVAGGLGVDVTMTSPSFVIVASYEGGEDGPDVNHIDLYRLHDYGEALAAGVGDAVRSDAVSLVEWADHVPEVLPAERIEIRFEPGRGVDERLIAIEPSGYDLGARLFDFMRAIIKERFS
ncbi:MAG: tRNA (adenosine(37)-N6)-threonylcarbamoyltransferase complex ATPase subunit type 1 TsaE [bacterium]